MENGFRSIIQCEFRFWQLFSLRSKGSNFNKLKNSKWVPLKKLKKCLTNYIYVNSIWSECMRTKCLTIWLTKMSYDIVVYDENDLFRSWFFLNYWSPNIEPSWNRHSEFWVKIDRGERNKVVNHGRHFTCGNIRFLDCRFVPRAVSSTKCHLLLHCQLSWESSQNYCKFLPRVSSQSKSLLPTIFATIWFLSSRKGSFSWSECTISPLLGRPNLSWSELTRISRQKNKNGLSYPTYLYFIQQTHG